MKYNDECKIRNIRRDFNISQVEVSNKLCAINQCVANWKNDSILPSVDVLIKLAKSFNVSTNYLLGLDSDNIIDVIGLTSSEIAHIKLLVDDLRINHKELQYKK